MASWTVERSTGSAGAFHQRDISGVDRPTVWIHRVERRALVLGSSQRTPIVDLDRAQRLDVEVCRRRSGGGLVLVEPWSSCWIDLLIPPTSRLWNDDVNAAFLWVGEVWKRALERFGVADLRVHDGPPIRAELGRFLCFAGIGSGEVVRRLDTGSDIGWSKVVGLSQRRQRTVARFQGLFVASTDMDLTVSLVDPDAWPLGLDPDAVRVGLEQPIDLDALEVSVVDELPTP